MGEFRDQNRIQPVDPDHASGAIGRLFGEIRAKFALVPKLFRVLANAPVALEGLLGLSAALARGALDEKARPMPEPMRSSSLPATSWSSVGNSPTQISGARAGG